MAYLVLKIFFFLIVNAGKTPVIDKHGKKRTSAGIFEDMG